VSPTKNPGARPTRSALSRERIVAAALIEVDEHGLESLTMQGLATKLGAGAMSLYNHVKNKDDLLAAISNLIWEEIAAASPAQEDPATWLESLGRAIRDAARRHPKALPVLVAGGVFPPALLEVIADHFERSGDPEPDPKLVDGITTVSAFALGWAAIEASDLGPGVRWSQETERQRIRRVTRALPAETPDRLVDAAIAVCAADAEPVFNSGLAAIIAGCRYTTGTPRTAPPGGSRQKPTNDTAEPLTDESLAGEDTTLRTPPAANHVLRERNERRTL
jgi:AcrR family transcriptional regulator